LLIVRLFCRFVAMRSVLSAFLCLVWALGFRREAARHDLGQCAEFAGVQLIMPMIVKLPENVPTPANGFVIFVVLCLFIIAGMAFAKFMQEREAKRRGH
jgi:glucose dehydrogenase